MDTNKMYDEDVFAGIVCPREKLDNARKQYYDMLERVGGIHDKEAKAFIDATYLPMLKHELRTNNPEPKNTPKKYSFWRDASLDNFKTFDRLLKAAKRGNIAAQYAVSECYRFGKMGVEINKGEANVWFSKASKNPRPHYVLPENEENADENNDSLNNDMSSPVSEVSSGEKADNICYFLHGDEFASLQLRKADNGDADAQLYLANSYYDKADSEFEWLILNNMLNSCGFSKREQKAYNRDNRNYQVALYWYTKALENGKEQARSRLVHMYSKGLGTDKDEKTAEYWRKYIPRKEVFGTPCGTTYPLSTYRVKSYIEGDEIIRPSGERLSLRKIKNELTSKMSQNKEFIVELRNYKGKLRTYPFAYFTGDRFHIDFGCFSFKEGPDVSLSASKYDSKIFTSYGEFMNAVIKAGMTEEDICISYADNELKIIEFSKLNLTDAERHKFSKDWETNGRIIY